jgi:D-alanyl-D-alanine carboxypeptidase-like protein
MPRDIVDIFERHGFIWGGKWYDTMHFEYRPELLSD